MASTRPVTVIAQHVLVVGAYGLIGYGIAQKLIADGHQVAGLGRNLQTAHRVLPGIQWIKRDIRTLRDVAAWSAVIDGFSIVINCSGALQDGPDDDLEAIHNHAVRALAAACASADVALIQISAVGSHSNASTPFLASKGRGDDAIKASGARFHIFRPGLVLAPNAYGGTAMLRMLAAVPFFQPIAAPDAPIQTVALNDVAGAVAAAVANKIPYGLVADLVEPEAHSLRNIVSAVRQWLGFRAAPYELVLPGFGVAAISKVADALSGFGWRSPLRSTAVKVLAEGVRGEPADLARFGLSPASSLQQTLSRMPVGVQDRLFARMALLTPIILFSLSLFWLASGFISLARLNDAALILETAGWPTAVAMASVVFWALIDIAIGAAFVVRKYAYGACWAAVAVSVFYLLAATIAVPELWVDPLGPLVKVVPAIILAIVARVVLDAR